MQDRMFQRAQRGGAAYHMVPTKWILSLNGDSHPQLWSLVMQAEEQG